MQYNSINIDKFISILKYPVEMRVPNAVENGKNVGVVSGFYTDKERLITACEYWSGKAPAVYITLNQVDENLLALSNNKFTRYSKWTTEDKHIVRRVLLGVDVDAIKPHKHIMASEVEYANARQIRDMIRRLLCEEGFPEPLVARSGNGGHLVFAVDLPNSEPVTETLKRFYATLRQMYEIYSDEGDIDETIYNTSRIWKVYGTKVCKGDEYGDRKHRYAEIESMPEKLEVLPLATIEAFIDNYYLPPEVTGSSGPLQSIERVRDFAKRHGLQIDREKKDSNDRDVFRLRTCPMCGESDKSAVFTVGSDGVIGYKCHHNRCSGKGWQALKEHLGEGEPEVEDVQAKATRATEWDGSGGTGKPNDDDKLKKERPSQAKRLEDLLKKCNLELFHSPDKIGYATIPVADRFETYPITSSNFRNWVYVTYNKATGDLLSKANLDKVLDTYNAKAIASSPRREVYLRSAYVDGVIYLDLCNDQWEVVEIRPTGWKVVRESPVKFYRMPNQAALPLPQFGGSINEFRKFINVSDDGSLAILISWMLDCLKGHGPYHVLIANGEQGSAKTTTLKMLSSTVDPCIKAETSTLPANDKELGVDGFNRFVLVYDNISYLPPWLSDALCRVATGAGIKNRKLYTDGEQHVFGFTRPICLNGIPDFAEAPDLLDRAMIVTLPPISEDKRMTEKEFDEALAEAKPRLLGALLSLAAQGLASQHDERLLPRMADSYLWMAKCSHAAPWGYELFRHAYSENRQIAWQLAIESSAIAPHIAQFVEMHKGCFRGTSTRLFEQLNGMVDWAIRDDKRWPSNPRSLTNRLKRDRPALRQLGIEFVDDDGRDKYAKYVRLSKMK